MVSFQGRIQPELRQMILLLRVCAIAVAGVSVAFGQLPAGTPPEEDSVPAASGLDPEVIQVFQSLDRDRDGQLSPREYLAGRLAEAAVRRGGREWAGVLFGGIDSDKNRLVSLLEFSRAQNTRNIRLLGESGFGRFHDLDLDGDGFISAEEFGKAEGKWREFSFAAVDRNQSGKIGPFEFLRVDEGGEEGRNPAVADEFIQMDKNDNGTIEEKEFLAGKADSTGTPLDQLFLRVDLNGNGEVAPREFFRFREAEDMAGIDARTREQFERADRNRDGTLSLREYSQTRIADRIKDRDVVSEIFNRIDRNRSGDIDLKEFSTRMEIIRRAGKFR